MHGHVHATPRILAAATARIAAIAMAWMSFIVVFWVFWRRRIFYRVLKPASIEIVADGGRFRDRTFASRCINNKAHSSIVASLLQ